MLLLFVLTILGSCLLQGRQSWEYLYNIPNRNVVDSVMNDTINDDYVFLDIYEFKDSFALVNVSHLESNKEHFGWIRQDALGIYLCQDADSVVNLCSKPFFGSVVCDSVVSPIWGEMYRVTGARDGWLYIDDRGKKGWVPRDNQCCNPYSCCN